MTLELKVGCFWSLFVTKILKKQQNIQPLIHYCEYCIGDKSHDDIFMFFKQVKSGLLLCYISSDLCSDAFAHLIINIELLQINVTESMFCMNRTTSVPKSVLHYDVDKDLTSV